MSRGQGYQPGLKFSILSSRCPVNGFVWSPVTRVVNMGRPRQMFGFLALQLGHQPITTWDTMSWFNCSLDCIICLLCCVCSFAWFCLILLTASFHNGRRSKFFLIYVYTIYSCIEVIYFQPTRLLEFPWRITQVWFKDLRVAMAQGYLSILNLVVPQWIRQLCCLIRLPPAALLQLAIPPTGHPHVWPPNKSMMTGEPPESPEFELRLGKFWRKEAGLEIADCVVLLLGKYIWVGN